MKYPRCTIYTYISLLQRACIARNAERCNAADYWVAPRVDCEDRVLTGGLSDPGHGLSLWPCLWRWPVALWILKLAQQTPFLLLIIIIRIW